MGRLSNLQPRDPRVPVQEAWNAGGQSENEVPPEDQRSPDPRSDLSDGPDIGPAGEYRPARYKMPNGKIREDR